MRSRLLFTISVVALGAAACATGSTFVGGGGTGSGADTTTVTTSSSMSTSTGMTTSSSTGSSTTGSSTSTSGGCSESPCKLTGPQCGCGAGMACTIAPGAKVRSCQTSGSTQQGQACSAPTQCAPGTLCVGICTLFCSTDADCASAGGICALQLSDGTAMGSIPNVKLCTGNCNVVNGTGCPTGTGCDFGQEQTGAMRNFTFCETAGTGAKNSPCTSNAQCQPTFACINNGTATVCLKYCNVANVSACGGLGCTPLQDANMMPIIVGGTQLGVCT